MLYPGKAKTKYKKYISYANRGINLEILINESNLFYLKNDIAIIYKKPTPIAIKNTEYQGQKIKTTGFLQAKSTLDYVGIYKGKYLDFDAKSTRNKTSFSLNNISKHQLDHINNILNHGGIAFLIIEMNDNIFILKGEDLINFIKNEKRKSLPYDYLLDKGYEIKIGLNPRVDYLKQVEKIYLIKE